jgi:hypothetical protein
MGGDWSYSLQGRFDSCACSVDVDVGVDWGRGHGATIPLHLGL